MFLFSRILMGRGAARAGKVPAPAPAPAAQSAGIELSNAPETLSLFGQHVIDSEVEQLYTTWCITRTLPPAYNPNRPAGDLGVAVALARDVLTSKGGPRPGCWPTSAAMAALSGTPWRGSSRTAASHSSDPGSLSRLGVPTCRRSGASPTTG